MAPGTKRPRTKRIGCHITFVIGPKGSDKVNPFIYNPEYMVEKFPGDGYVNNFSSLQETLSNYILTPDDGCKTWFHNNDKYIYSFSNSNFNGGSIYGLKEKRGKDSQDERITKKKLIPIKNNEGFDEYVRSCGVEIEEEQERTTRHSTTVSTTVHHVDIELCVLVGTEKSLIPRALSSSRQRRRPQPSSSSTTSTTVRSTTSSSSKRQKKLFKFKAKTLDILLHAPLETYEKSNSTVTAPQQGSKKKPHVQFDLKDYIKPKEPGDVDSDNEDEGTEIFKPIFTLPFFRLEMMKKAVKEFPAEYGYDKESLGEKVMLYILLQYNTNSWIEISDTALLRNTLKSQMNTRSRVNNGKLSVSMSFGRAQCGEAFESEDDLRAYEEGSEWKLFSESVVPHLPLVRQSASVMNRAIIDRNEAINNLVLLMYQTKECILYHGFLQEQHHPLFTIILNDVSGLKKTDSVFKKHVEEGTLPSNDLIRTTLTTTFANFYKKRDAINPNVAKCSLKKGLYPPTDVTMAETPPPFEDWFTTLSPQEKIRFHQQDSTGVLPCQYYRPGQMPPGAVPLHTVTPPQYLAHQTLTRNSLKPLALFNEEDIFSINFFYQGDDEAIEIDEPLSLDSKMLDVIKTTDLFGNNNCEDVVKHARVKFGKNENQSYKKYRFALFKDWSVKKYFRLSNLHEDCEVVLLGENETILLY